MNHLSKLHLYSIKGLLFAIFILSGLTSTSGQTCLADPHTGIGLYLGGRFYTPLKMNNYGVNILKTRYAPAPALGIRFQHDSRKWTNFGFALSFGGSLHSYSYKYDYTMDKDNPLAHPDPFIDDKGISMFVPELTAGASVYYRKHTRDQNHQFYLELGINSTFIPSFESTEGLYTSIDTVEVELFTLKLEHDQDVAYLTAKVAAGFEFVFLNRKNSVRLEYNIQRKSIYTGSYMFNITPNTSYGTLKGTNSYFALTYNIFFRKLIHPSSGKR